MSNETIVSPARSEYSRQAEDLKLAMNLIDQAVELMDDFSFSLGKEVPLWQRPIIWLARRRYRTLRGYARAVKRVLPPMLGQFEARRTGGA